MVTLKSLITREKPLVVTSKVRKVDFLIMNNIQNIHQTFDLIDVLGDHHFDRIYERFHELFGEDKDTCLCKILAIDRCLRQVTCKFEENIFKVDL